MRVVVSGASGFLGGVLCRYLEGRGHSTVRLVRRLARGAAETHWDPGRQALDPRKLAGAHVVVNLSGASLAGRRWTAAYKRELRASRLDPTATLAEALASLRRTGPDECPSLYVCASGAGYYGYRSGAAELTEESPCGSGFLAGLCRDWEAAAAPARSAGLRVVHLRLGAVLGAGGGALARLATLARCGLGSRLGSGQQMLSWLAAEELGPVIEHLAGHPELRGPVNAVAPQAYSNAEFNRLLCRVLGRLEFVPAPPLVLRILLGQMAEELLLGGQRAVPAKLAASGYRWRRPDIEPLLREILGQPA